MPTFLLQPIWILFETAVNLFQAFLSVFFLFRILKPHNHNSFLHSNAFFFIASLTFTITLCNYVFVYEHIFNLLYILLLFLYTLQLSKKNIIRKLFFSIYTIGLTLVISSTIAAAISSFLSQNMADIFSEYRLNRSLGVLSVQIMLFLCFEFTIQLFGKYKYIFGKKEWSITISGLLLSSFLTFLLNLIAVDVNSDAGKTLLMGTFFTVLMMNVVIYFLMVLLGTRNREVRRLELESINKEFHTQYLTALQEEYDTMRQMRHDHRNIYQTLTEYLLQGQTEDALSYLHTLVEDLQAQAVFLNTDCMVQDAVLNSKLTIAKAHHIQVSCMTITAFPEIGEVDLCRLFANLLDNAVTAAKRCEESERFLELLAAETEEYYRITCRNSCPASTAAEMAAKAADEEHGLGLRIMKEIAEKYGGYGRFEAIGTVFVGEVTLYKE